MTADDTVTCSVCDEEITLGGSAHETWDNNSQIHNPETRKRHEIPRRESKTSKSFL